MVLRIVSLFLLAFSSLGFTQSFNPAAAEDAAIERQKILRAADQIEIVMGNVTRLEGEMQSLRQEIKSVREENQQLRQLIADNETRRQKEKDILLGEVAKAVSEATATAPTAKPEKKEVKKPSVKEEGYEHVVEKGQTLWIIAKAYKDQGVKVSVDDIRKANNLKASDSIRVGQKLFIPHK